MAYSCQQCRYFESRDKTCRFNAPQVQMAASPPGPETAEWPTVDPNLDWCGEFIQVRP
jgi:hypothetical protein